MLGCLSLEFGEEALTKDTNLGVVSMSMVSDAIGWEEISKGSGFWKGKVFE